MAFYEDNRLVRGYNTSEPTGNGSVRFDGEPETPNGNGSKPTYSTMNDDLLVVGVWTVLGIYGFLTNSCILLAILHHKKLCQSTSYWLIISLSLCDISMIIVCLGHLAPATILHEQYVHLTDFANAFGIFIYDSFWYASVLHLAAMSLNRYVNICRPKYYLRLFSRRKSAVIIFLLYCMGVVLATPGLFECCYLVFNSRTYAAQYERDETPYQYIDYTVNGGCIVVMIFCYTCIVVRVRRSRIMLQQYRKLYREQKTLQNKATAAYTCRNQPKSDHGLHSSASTKFGRLLRPNVPIISRREVRLFFQFATVSFIFFLTFALWGWLPQLSESKWVGFAVTSLFYINNCTNPTVYLIFNSVLRRQIQKIFCPFRADTMQRKNKAKRREHRETPGEPSQKVDKSKRCAPFWRRYGKGKRDFDFADELDADSLHGYDDRPAHGGDRRRRPSAQDPDDDDVRLLRTVESGDMNETTDAMLASNNATCNLMAMAAFLNTSTVTGRVLMKAMKDDEETRLKQRQSVTADTTDSCITVIVQNVDEEKREANPPWAEAGTEEAKAALTAAKDDTIEEETEESRSQHGSQGCLVEAENNNFYAGVILFVDDEPSVYL